MKRLLAVVIAVAIGACGLSALELPKMLQKAKEHFRHGAYTETLTALDKLEVESQKEGYEKDRLALRPVIAFYRGASYAALGRAPDARAQFEIFLAFQPEATLDPAVYPKKVIAAFDQAQRSLRARSEEPAPPGSNSVRLAYASFRVVTVEDEPALGEDWAEGPVRYLLSPDERRSYARLADPVSRSEYVTAFWKARDPRPETAVNEFRQEFERRVAFADSRFTQSETRGALTDRGMVFILLGPPTYVGRKPLQPGDDVNENTALFRYRRADVRIASMPGGSRAAQTARVDAVTNPGTRVNEAAQNWREVWHYRREHLPKEVPYLQVDFDFVTKAGYGENVLQRDTQVLDTIERVKSKLREVKA